MKKTEFKTIFVKFDEKRGVSHQLFIKQHKVRDKINERPSDLTLFVCNVPPYCTEESFKCLFSKFGSIQSVSFANTDAAQNKVIQDDGQVSVPKTVTGYKIGYVVFNSAASLQNVLALEEGTTLSDACSQKTLTTGLKKWCAAYNASFPDPVEMQKEIDSYMAQQDTNEAQKRSLAKSVAESDQDGWIPVSKRSRNPGFARKQSVKDNVARKMLRKKKKKALMNFYSFQIKESKMNHLITLRKKFEDDKKKVETLKVQRKFKPF
ncbi:ribosomal RNA-processing protein 7 homolog A [Planococcus citri]|uniref:ribosomal RNA-processing protein 7 homolog A n=1 Tax=Planococcus citri TaxID=170843 RepID=UPI0031FA4222